ncbi:MAG TPA: hypothetical protein VMR99_01110 [Candidatus Paceibacterota bacterium]|nr:hypothetical protein [Candidatus Paceibacterota bacterium]
MGYFKVMFGHWIDTSEPAFNGQQEALLELAKRKEIFYVEQPTLEAAHRYAKTFEGIETNACEGLSGLEEIKEILEAEAKEYLRNLSIYESYRRKTNSRRPI